MRNLVPPSLLSVLWPPRIYCAALPRVLSRLGRGDALGLSRANVRQGPMPVLPYYAQPNLTALVPPHPG